MQIEADKERSAERSSKWKSELFIVLFALAFDLGHSLLILLAVAQNFWLQFAGEPNPLLPRLGKSASVWFSDTARFLICASDRMPFPWRCWANVGEPA
jgi:hypothetical protein